jgi:hypothetical protein
MSMRTHELLGLGYQFLGATSIGIGIYNAVWFAMRPIQLNSIAATPTGADWLMFPLFFGIGAILWSLGSIELKDVVPTSRKAAKR